MSVRCLVMDIGWRGSSCILEIVTYTLYYSKKANKGRIGVPLWCGSGIRRFLDPWIRYPGWKKNPDSGPGSEMNTSQIIFRDLRNSFKGWFFYADPDPGSEIFLTLDPGSGMEKFKSGKTSRIRNTGWGTSKISVADPDRLSRIRFFCHPGSNNNNKKRKKI